jgi:hypothetical protein
MNIKCIKLDFTILTKQKVWLKEQYSIRLESECHLIACVWTAVKARVGYWMAVWEKEMCL